MVENATRVNTKARAAAERRPNKKDLCEILQLLILEIR